MANYNRKDQSFPENQKCKVVFLGDSVVGKSSLVHRFVKDEFIENKEQTHGVTYFTKRIQINNTIIRLEMWDTAGQERFRCLVPLYYRHSQAAIIVFDITNRNSFERAKNWTAELQENVPGALKLLVGNKLDLKELRSVEIDEESQMFASENGLFFLETSAKTNANITKSPNASDTEMTNVIGQSQRLVASEKNNQIKCCGLLQCYSTEQ